MKKLLLLLVSGSIALTAGAQERQMNPLSVTQEENLVKKNLHVSHEEMLPNFRGTAHKTTSGGDRWYNYAPYLDTNSVLAGFAGAGLTEELMWQDTTQIYQFTGTTPGTAHINLCSVGSIFDPSSIAYNDSNYYATLMKVGNSDAYVIDSVILFGKYNFNPAKTSIVDTLRLSFVKGKGLSTDDVFSGYSIVGGHYDADKFLEMHYDSVKNYARSGTATGTASSNVQDIILTSASWADTNANGVWIKRIGLTNPLSMVASGIAGMSISFKSGDVLPTSLPGDTIIYANGNNKYNQWDPVVNYASDAAGAAQWPVYAAVDSNVGMFRRLYVSGWSKLWLPTWAWSTSNGTAASTFQYPDISWHVTCTTCGVITWTEDHSGVNNVYVINKANAYPNPATAQLNIPFSLTQNAQVTVSLSNMIGQTVASQDMGVVSAGKAVFNTTAIPAGVYTYSVIANGQRSTGRVVVAH